MKNHFFQKNPAVELLHGRILRLLYFQKILKEPLQLLISVEIADIHLVTHAVGDGVGHSALHLHAVAVALHDGVVIQTVAFVISAANVCAIVPGAVDSAGTVIKGDHVSPELVNVSLVGVVVHIGGETAGRPHIDLKTDDVSPLAQTFLILVQNEKLKMNETAPDTEGFHCTAACITDLVGQVVDDVVQGFLIVVYHIHK